ncbi:MAG: aspartate--tRNA(Asn) ligase [Candidatus Pacearchaeota archaeon]
MERKYTSEISEGEEVRLMGWAFEIRALSKMAFILLRDASGMVQCVIKDQENLGKIAELNLESVIEVKGKANKSEIKAEHARKDIEIEVSELNVLNKSDPLPIHVNEKTTSTELNNRIDNRFLDVRKPKVQAIFKIQSTIINAFREYFYENGFTEIQPPGIISTSTEGGTDLFEIKYFEKNAYLAQSPQLYKQLMAISLEKVFSTRAVWRAEKHDTGRHINEIKQMDMEASFVDDFGAMRYLAEAVQHIAKKVNEHCQQEIKALGAELKVPDVKYLTYKETIDLLNEHGLEISEGKDLEPEAERKINEIYPDTIVFVYEWPLDVRPFYIWPKDDKVSAGFDAIYGGIEISSGGQRIHKPEILTERVKSKELDPKNLQWYIDAFKYGAPYHSGWSIGLERMTQTFLNLDNIREATLFPRDRKRLSP